MKKNSTRKEKLRNYSVFAGTLVAATAANAQVVYTDVNPDVTKTTGNNYMLDMNNDASPEFTITAATRSGSISGASYTGVGIAVTTVGSNTAVIAHTGSTVPVNYVDALGFGTVIDNTGNFMSAPNSSGSSALVMAAVGNIGGFFPFSVGAFLGQNDQYMGVVFGISGNLHYGWARFDVDANATQFTIKDYAYDGTATNPVSAGDNGSAVSEYDLRDQMDMMIMNDELIINVMNNQLSNGRVYIMNLSGQEVASYALNSTSGKYDVSAFASGMYIINVRFDQGMASEKLFVR